MTTPPNIPFDIAYHITRQLQRDNDADRKALHACTLVSELWSRAARPRLFSSVGILVLLSNRDIPSFNKLLESNPSLAPFVNDLTIRCGSRYYHSDINEVLQLADLWGVVRQLPSLKSLCLEKLALKNPKPAWSSTDVATHPSSSQKPNLELLWLQNVYIPEEKSEEAICHPVTFLLSMFSSVGTLFVEPIHDCSGYSVILPQPPHSTSSPSVVSAYELMYEPKDKPSMSRIALSISDAFGLLTIAHQTMRSVRMETVTSLEFRVFEQVFFNPIYAYQALVDAAPNLRSLKLTKTNDGDTSWNPQRLVLSSCKKLEIFTIAVGFGTSSITEDLTPFSQVWLYSLSILATLPSLSSSFTVFRLELFGSLYLFRDPFHTVLVDWSELERVLDLIRFKTKNKGHDDDANDPTVEGSETSSADTAGSAEQKIEVVLKPRTFPRENLVEHSSWEFFARGLKSVGQKYRIQLEEDLRPPFSRPLPIYLKNNNPFRDPYRYMLL